MATAYGVVAGDRANASRWTFYIGKDGDILFIDTQVSTSTAGKDVAARLAALGVAKRQ